MLTANPPLAVEALPHALPLRCRKLVRQPPPACRRRLLWGIPLGQLLGDAAGGLLLVAAVALVFLFDRRGTLAYPLAATVSLVPRPEAAEPSQPRPLRLAITPPKYDDMGQLLGTLGAGYQYTELRMDDLLYARASAGFRRGLRHLRQSPGKLGQPTGGPR